MKDPIKMIEKIKGMVIAPDIIQMTHSDAKLNEVIETVNEMARRVNELYDNRK